MNHVPPTVEKTPSSNLPVMNLFAKDVLPTRCLNQMHDRSAKGSKKQECMERDVVYKH